MKKHLWYAAAAITLASCSESEFVGDLTTNPGAGEITFGISSENTTRATGKDAAEKLNSKFVVYGWKSTAWAAGTNTGDAGAYTDAADVFKNYVVTYNGLDGQTETNTKGWEYVGNTSEPIGATGVEQSIKYWDYSTAQYDFIAWSITPGGNAIINEIGTSSVNPYKIHNLSFSASSASDLANVYVSDQKTVEKANYKNVVELSFRNLATKVRVGLYETVPGYSVKDVRFYTDATTTTAAAETSATLYDATPTAVFASSGSVKVEYRDGSNGTVNEAVVTTDIADADSKAQFGNLDNLKGADKHEEATNKYLGRTSAEASMPAKWTYEFPKAASELTLRCDYTLVSTDGSGETIKVRNAKAVVPSNYGEWKANYAYTYLFKISDNTNGTTGDPGTGDPSDPSDPSGLYPITFDAVVVDVQTGNTQETITEFAEIPITTYQKGSENTKESEYKAFATNGWLYVNNNAEAMYTKTTSGEGAVTANTKLYVAVDIKNDKEGITEETVANYANNDIVLIDVTAATAEAVKDVTKIEAADSYDNVEKTLDKAGFRFKPQAGQTYVVEFTNAAGKKVYKVIKVVGTATNTFALTVDNATVAEGSSVTVTAKVGDNLVYGAKNCFTGASAFTITDNNDGTYGFKANAGSTATQSVKLGNSDALVITVNAYEFAATNVDVNEGANNTITLNLNGNTLAACANQTEAETAGFAISGTGLSITSVTAAGVVTIAAAAGAESGTIKYKDLAEATVTVKSYALTAAPAIINKGQKSTLTLTLGGDAANVPALTSNDETVIASTTAAASNIVEVTGLKKGTATFSNTTFATKATVEVIDAAVSFQSTAATPADVAIADLAANTTYTMTFKDNDVATNAALVGENCTISKKADAGVYKVVTGAAGSIVKVKYTYKGVEFVLAEKTL